MVYCKADKRKLCCCGFVIDSRTVAINKTALSKNNYLADIRVTKYSNLSK